MSYTFADFCCCPQCRSDLRQIGNSLNCVGCDCTYPIESDIAVLMPDYAEDETARRYHDNYEKLADNFLRTNKYAADRVAYRHGRLLKFIGRRKRGRVLDIGSSHGRYLGEVDAAFKVAFDIARTYLDVMEPAPNMLRVQGDAEFLPFKAGFFDTIILADILEHIRNVEKVAELIHQLSDDQTTIIVHIPWEENLEQYVNGPWEFSHLRSFNAYTHSVLWHKFSVRRAKVTYPDLRYPPIFQLEGILPKYVYNWLVRRYFYKPGVTERDNVWRQRRLQALPHGEWWLLRLYKPVFKMYEMRRHPIKPVRQGLFHRVEQALR